MVARLQSYEREIVRRQQRRSTFLLRIGTIFLPDSFFRFYSSPFHLYLYTYFILFIFMESKKLISFSQLREQCPEYGGKFDIFCIFIFSFPLDFLPKIKGTLKVVCILYFFTYSIRTFRLIRKKNRHRLGLYFLSVYYIFCWTARCSTKCQTNFLTIC